METTTRSERRQELLVVKIGDMKISRDPSIAIVTYALGSCLGITAYDPELQLGGMVHFMLAEPTSEVNKDRRPLAYGSIAVPAFFRALFDEGARKERLIVKIAGGANMMKSKNPFRIGEQNYELTKKLLDHNSIQIAASDCGGIYGRTLRLYIKDGRCTVTNPTHKEVEI